MPCTVRHLPADVVAHVGKFLTFRERSKALVASRAVFGAIHHANTWHDFKVDELPPGALAGRLRSMARWKPGLSTLRFCCHCPVPVQACGTERGHEIAAAAAAISAAQLHRLEIVFDDCSCQYVAECLTVVGPSLAAAKIASVEITFGRSIASGAPLEQLTHVLDAVGPSCSVIDLNVVGDHGAQLLTHAGVMRHLTSLFVVGVHDVCLLHLTVRCKSVIVHTYADAVVWGTHPITAFGVLTGDTWSGWVPHGEHVESCTLLMMTELGSALSPDLANAAREALYRLSPRTKLFVNMSPEFAACLPVMLEHVQGRGEVVLLHDGSIDARAGAFLLNAFLLRAGRVKSPLPVRQLSLVILRDTPPPPADAVSNAIDVGEALVVAVGTHGDDAVVASCFSRLFYDILSPSARTAWHWMALAFPARLRVQ